MYELVVVALDMPIAEVVPDMGCNLLEAVLQADMVVADMVDPRAEYVADILDTQSMLAAGVDNLDIH